MIESPRMQSIQSTFHKFRLIEHILTILKAGTSFWMSMVISTRENIYRSIKRTRFITLSHGKSGFCHSSWSKTFILLIHKKEGEQVSNMVHKQVHDGGFVQSIIYITGSYGATVWWSKELSWCISPLTRVLLSEIPIIGGWSSYPCGSGPCCCKNFRMNPNSNYDF